MMVVMTELPHPEMVTNSNFIWLVFVVVYGELFEVWISLMKK